MRYAFIAALVLSAAAISTAASGQQASITQSIAGTRLDVSATGEVTRVPDVAVITAGVQSRAQTARAAVQDSSNRMAQVLSALKGAGIADRDIQTSNMNLSPEYRYPENQSPQLVGYAASNSVTIRFRDVRNSGKILDALVAVGANQISGPNLIVDKPESALDEARAKAIATARARAELYARNLGMRVVRVVAVAESGGYYAPPPPAVPMIERAQMASSRVEPGEQKLQVSVSMTFELQ